MFHSSANRILTLSLAATMRAWTEAGSRNINWKFFFVEGHSFKVEHEFKWKLRDTDD